MPQEGSTCGIAYKQTNKEKKHLYPSNFGRGDPTKEREVKLYMEEYDPCPLNKNSQNTT